MSSAEVVAGTTVTLQPLAGEQPQDVALDAVVDGDDVELRRALAAIALAPFPRRLVPGEALPARHHRHEVHADEARPCARLRLERVEIEAARSAACAITALGMPFSRMRLVSARVSMPASPITPRAP